MNIRELAKYYYRGIRSLYKQMKIRNNEEFQENFLVAELIRCTHSIEKGLSIENPRLGYGHEKLKLMEQMITQLSGGGVYHEACIMALAAMKSYLRFHEEKGYVDAFHTLLAGFVDECLVGDSESKEAYGGVVRVSKQDLVFNEPEIEYFFQTRHSIRDFEDSDIDLEKLEKALKLAQRAPSACNRQGVRVHVLISEDSVSLLSKQLSGAGGFADSTKCFAIITAKLSAYRSDEMNQYIVSASIYAAYLTLTLHLYGMGGCVVQRSVIYGKEWESNKRIFKMDDDEQVICLVAIGNLKDSFNVPVSHRLENGFIQFY